MVYVEYINNIIYIKYPLVSPKIGDWFYKYHIVHFRGQEQLQSHVSYNVSVIVQSYEPSQVVSTGFNFNLEPQGSSNQAKALCGFSFDLLLKREVSEVDSQWKYKALRPGASSLI